MTLTDDPELRHTESGIAPAMFRVSGRREQEGRRRGPPPAAGIAVRSFSTTSRPALRTAADNRGKLIDTRPIRAEHYAARPGRISVEGVK